MSSIEIGKRTDKTEDNPYGYVKVDSIPKDEVCVLYLGGDGATSDEAANGYAKIIKNEILSEINPDIPVYSIKYDFQGHKKSVARKVANIKHHTEVLVENTKIDNTLSEATDEEHNPKYVDELFEKAILPRITLHNKKGKLATEEACKRIRKLNIVAHCHGAYTALKLEEKMQAAMKELGYSEQDRKKIQSQLLIVALAPACPLGISKSQFVSFQSAYDYDIPQKGNFFDHYINMRKREEIRRFYAEEDKDADKIKNNRWFDLKPCYFPGKQGNLFLVKQKYKWTDCGPALINGNEHNNVSFNGHEQTPNGKLLAHFSKTILKNGIKNSLLQDTGFTPLPPIETLILSDDPIMRQKETIAFAKMKQNGKKFREEIFLVARDFHQQKQTGS